MKTEPVIHRLLALFLAAVLSGCASSTGGLISSLEDLSTDSVKEGFVKIPQYRVASIPGWLPFADVGGLYFYKPSRKPASVIGLSPDGTSFELVSEIPSECTETCLAAIRSLITRLGTLSSELVQERVSLLAAQVKKPPDQASLDKAAESYGKAQKSFNSTYEAVVDALKHNGVLIYRWSIDARQSGHIGFDSLLGSSAQNQQTLNGFALVSGIRTKTLFIGTDLLAGWSRLDKESRFNNRFEMTTHVMQAKNIMYGAIADLSTFAQAKLEASYKQLANLPEELKTLAQIEIGISLSKVSNLSNMGVMGNINRKIVPIRWDANDLKTRLSEDQWLTFFSVESDFTDMLELLKQSRPPM